MTTYELTMIDSGRTGRLSYEECVRRFGVEEFNEILQGYAPHIVAFEVDPDVELELDVEFS